MQPSNTIRNSLDPDNQTIPSSVMCKAQVISTPSRRFAIGRYKLLVSEFIITLHNFFDTKYFHVI